MRATDDRTARGCHQDAAPALILGGVEDQSSGGLILVGAHLERERGYREEVRKIGHRDSLMALFPVEGAGVDQGVVEPVGQPLAPPGYRHQTIRWAA